MHAIIGKRLRLPGIHPILSDYLQMESCVAEICSFLLITRYRQPMLPSVIDCEPIRLKQRHAQTQGQKNQETSCGSCLFVASEVVQTVE